MKSSTCALDPISKPLLKSNAAAISPLISCIINSSLQTGQVPTTLKSALISPILKKPTLDPEILSSYRPISNLPFLSKVLEKAVAAQIQVHTYTHNLFE